MLLISRVSSFVVGREGVVKMGCGGNIPRVTGQRARKEGAGVVNKVRDDHLYEFLWKIGY